MADTQQATETTVFACKNCGGNLEFQPGAQSLQCPFCGTTNEIEGAAPPEVHEELDYQAALANLTLSTGTVEATNMKCGGCGAAVTITPPETTADCAYCGTQVVSTGPAEQVLSPQYILPFKLDKASAAKKFKAWITSRRFAPNKLKAYTRISEPVKGIYYPFWTFDANTATSYTGMRGIFYQETIRTRDAEGKTVTRTVTKTRWYPASGRVSRIFDDILIPASASLEDDVVRKLSTFPLNEMVAYQPSYLSGFTGESYSVELETGFATAKTDMESVIRSDVRRDIGGDTQQIHSMNTAYSDVTFKYVVLPIYALKYRFKKKLYPVVINGVTGEVQGKRPYSWIKILLTVLGVAAVLVGGYFLLDYFGAFQ
ncbi:MAG: hypothetical protein ACLFNT_14780 [Spirochaetales bacterium]